MATRAYVHYTYAIQTNGDGTLGYTDGKKYIALYGRLQQVSEVTPVKVKHTREQSTTTRVRVGLEYMSVDLTANDRTKYEESSSMENILFRYKTTEIRSEVEYEQQEWREGYGVRRLYAAALLGSGAILKSNQDRVYVLDSSIPHENEMVGRGYLKVDGSDRVEHFLGGMRWASRCEGVRSMPTETGLKVATFVIKDKTRHQSTGYYVVCTESRLPRRVICHLVPIGRKLDLIRKFVRHAGDNELGPWARRVHDAESFLFD